MGNYSLHSNELLPMCFDGFITYLHNDARDMGVVNVVIRSSV